VASHLDLPALTYVFKIHEIDFGANTISVERLLEGRREVVEGPLPAVVAVVKDINQPRYPTLMGIRRASKREKKPPEKSRAVARLPRV